MGAALAGDLGVNEEIVQLGLMDDDNIELDEAALALAALDNPGIDLAPYRATLNDMAAQLERRRNAAGSVFDQAALLAGVISGEHGFRGEAHNYDDPANADLISVMDRKRGMPITLSILYVALARRIGWTAVGLNTPGHLLVRIGKTPTSVVIDPFNAGVVVGRDAVAELLKRAGAAGMTPEAVTPLSNQAMLVRLLLNQATRARSAGHLERALTVYQRMTTVAPLMSNLWWERAEVERQLGHIAAARASLNAMLETTREPDLRKHIRATLDSLTRSMH
jgi:regulator of sirC expression with transglutaminase-like and TPR domain